MKTTGIFKILSYTIDVEAYNEPITIIPFGDVHRDSPLCHAQMWKEFCHDNKDRKNTYYLGMGDYLDGCSTSERGAFNFHALHDATHTNLDRAAEERVESFAEEISFMRGKIIGILNGNHYWEYRDGTTTDHHLARLLETNFLGVSSFIRLTFRRDRYKAVCIDLWVHHGAGGGATPGASINRLDKMRTAAVADIYLMGHNHKKQIAKESILCLSKGGSGSVHLENKTCILGRTGSFLKGYEPDASSYIADGAHGPCDLGVIKIIATPRRSRSSNIGRERLWVDLEGVL